ncbi:MAG: amino acid permease [Acidobacteriota bacterium]|nr:MAG: amino acid permease [Acidobacteriota bacterium]
MTDSRPFETHPEPSQKFGTFLGVFTPSVLTILGLIMYLRFGWVVGNVGLLLTVLIVLLASSVTFVTALSASALATNMRVGVGGEYFMVARSLGLELGGMIGIPLFLCRTLSITFYSYGLAESIMWLWPPTWGAAPARSVPILAGLTVVVITAIAGKSAGLALKLQIPIMVLVGASLMALTAGALSSGVAPPTVTPSYRTAPGGFWYVFSVFFPAVTGFTAGIGLSGDLKDPRRSIPLGTLLAVVTGTAVYLLVPTVLSVSSRISVEELLQPGVGVWTATAVLGAWLVFPGMWGAILSSAFGSVLGGPRVLQALARDGLAPAFLARVSKTGQPVVATWISGSLALIAVALGGLNAVAQFVTILFLTLYVTINLSAAAEKWAGDASYRPTINVPWYVSLAGSLGAIAVMFLINPWACLAAISLEIVLYLYLRRRSLRQRWGDARAGVWMSVARLALLRLRSHESDPRNWRPHILLFLGDAEKRIGLVRLANWFNQDRGLVTACQLIVGDLTKQQIEIEAEKSQMEHALAGHGLVAFTEVDVVPEFESGVIATAQASGISGLQSNTVMVGWPSKPDRLEAWLRIMRALSRAGKSMLITRLQWRHEPGMQPRIDLWWGGLQNNGDMMLLLAHLLSVNPEWRDARIVVRSIARDEKEREVQIRSLAALLEEVRIRAETEVIMKPEEESIADVIKAQSRSADIVFLGLQEQEPGSEGGYARRLEQLAAALNTTVFVRSAGRFAGRLIDSQHLE